MFIRKWDVSLFNLLRWLSADFREYQRDTQYYNHTKSTKPGILFPAFCGSAKRTLRNEGRVGFTPLNDFNLHGEELNINKNTTK